MMRNEIGNREFPVWLLGDSEPENKQNYLEYPLDPRHPARSIIWTPVADVIQREAFIALGRA